MYNKRGQVWMASKRDEWIVTLTQVDKLGGGGGRGADE